MPSGFAGEELVDIKNSHYIVIFLWLEGSGKLNLIFQNELFVSL
jgi:hypothetical protein